VTAVAGVSGTDLIDIKRLLRWQGERFAAEGTSTLDSRAVFRRPCRFRMEHDATVRRLRGA
jgi:hypothetical protein